MELFRSREQELATWREKGTCVWKCELCTQTSQLYGSARIGFIVAYLQNRLNQYELGPRRAAEPSVIPAGEVCKMLAWFLNISS